MKQSSNSVLSFSAMPIAFAALVLVNEVSAPDTLVAVVGLIVPVICVPSTSNVLICVNPVLIIWFSVAVTFAPPFSALDPEPPSNAGLLVRVMQYMNLNLYYRLMCAFYSPVTMELYVTERTPLLFACSFSVQRCLLCPNQTRYRGCRYYHNT